MADLDQMVADLKGWQEAYPLSSFPEPDLDKAAKLLKAGGMTLDSVSASNMRHVASKAIPVALAAIEQARREERERCIDLVKAQKEQFSDPDYAGGPIGAFGEIFACHEIIAAISAQPL